MYNAKRDEKSVQAVGIRSKQFFLVVGCMEEEEAHKKNEADTKGR